MEKFVRSRIVGQARPRLSLKCRLSVVGLQVVDIRMELLVD